MVMPADVARGKLDGGLSASGNKILACGPTTALPTDTILDPDPPGGLCGIEIDLLKYVYLTQLRDIGGTATEIIDAAEGLRRKGMAAIVADGDGLRLKPTPLGAVDEWLRGVMEARA